MSVYNVQVLSLNNVTILSDVRCRYRQTIAVYLPRKKREDVYLLYMSEQLSEKYDFMKLYNYFFQVTDQLVYKYA